MQKINNIKNKAKKSIKNNIGLTIAITTLATSFTQLVDIVKNKIEQDRVRNEQIKVIKEIVFDYLRSDEYNRYVIEHFLNDYVKKTDFTQEVENYTQNRFLTKDQISIKINDKIKELVLEQLQEYKVRNNNSISEIRNDVSMLKGDVSTTVVMSKQNSKFIQMLLQHKIDKKPS